MSVSVSSAIVCSLTIVCVCVCCVLCVVSSSVEVFIRSKYERKLYIAKGEQPKKPEQDKSKVGIGKRGVGGKESIITLS